MQQLNRFNCLVELRPQSYDLISVLGLVRCLEVILMLARGISESDLNGALCVLRVQRETPQNQPAKKEDTSA